MDMGVNAARLLLLASQVQKCTRTLYYHYITAFCIDGPLCAQRSAFRGQKRNLFPLDGDVILGNVGCRYDNAVYDHNIVFHVERATWVVCSWARPECAIISPPRKIRRGYQSSSRHMGYRRTAIGRRWRWIAMPSTTPVADVPNPTKASSRWRYNISVYYDSVI